MRTVRNELHHDDAVQPHTDQVEVVYDGQLRAKRPAAHKAAGAEAEEEEVTVRPPKRRRRGRGASSRVIFKLV